MMLRAIRDEPTGKEIFQLLELAGLKNKEETREKDSRQVETVAKREISTSIAWYNGILLHQLPLNQVH